MKYAGRDFMLQVRVAGEWTSCRSDRSTSFTVGNEQVDTTGKDDGPWRNLSGMGIRSSDIACSGVITDRATMGVLLAAVFAGEVIEAQVIHGPTAEVVAGGWFLVASCERSGEHNGAEGYSIALNSAATVTTETPPTPPPTPPTADLLVSLALPESVVLSADATLTAVAVDGDTLYLGGIFTTVNGEARTGFAAVDMATGTVLPLDIQISGGHVTTIAPDGTTVYVGGQFSTVNGLGCAYLAKLDTLTETFDPAFPQANGIINSIALTPTHLLVGGIQSQVGGTATGVLAAVDLSDNSVQGISNNASSIYGIATGGNRAVVVGSFSTILGDARGGGAVIDTDTLTLNADAFPTLDTYLGGAAGINADGTLYAVGGYDGKVYLKPAGDPLSYNVMNANAYIYGPMRIRAGNILTITGGFTNVNGQARLRFAEFDYPQFQLTARTLNADNLIQSHALWGGQAVIVGGFSAVNGASHPFVYAEVDPAEVAVATLSPSWTGDVVNESLVQTGAMGTIAIPLAGNGVPVSASLTADGSYTWTLTVTDSAAQVATDAVTQEVSAAGPFVQSTTPNANYDFPWRPASSPEYVFGGNPYDATMGAYMGAVECFDRVNETWTRILPTEPGTPNNSGFGSDCYAAHGTLIIGSYGKDSSQGALYAYDIATLGLIARLDDLPAPTPGGRELGRPGTVAMRADGRIYASCNNVYGAGGRIFVFDGLTYTGEYIPSGASEFAQRIFLSPDETKLVACNLTGASREIHVIDTTGGGVGMTEIQRIANPVASAYFGLLITWDADSLGFWSAGASFFAAIHYRWNGSAFAATSDNVGNPSWVIPAADGVNVLCCYADRVDKKTPAGAILYTWPEPNPGSNQLKSTYWPQRIGATEFMVPWASGFNIATEGTL